VFSQGLTIIVLLLLVMPVQAAMEDPTRPPSLSGGKAVAGVRHKPRPRWRLSSTLISPQRRSAVIDGRVVVRGDRINGATVISIESGAVRLRAKGREFTLLLLEKEIKSLSRVQTSALNAPVAKTAGVEKRGPGNGS
jgi:MSHA biogenesis protein MshK